MKEFFDTLFGMGKARRKDLIEKDYYLHILLARFAEDEYLAENLFFTGGSCLIKAHLGYYRFSEDIDFTWTDQGLWEGKTPTRIRALCSELIDTMTTKLAIIAREVGLEFKPQKDNRDYVEIGSGGRMVRFFVWYQGGLGRTRIKLEVNFYELLLFPFVNLSMNRYVEEISPEKIEILRFRFPEQMAAYDQEVRFHCYTLEEIFIEKCRAILTRQVVKLRDYIDIAILEHHSGFSIQEMVPKIVEKTNFILDLYQRYRDNIYLLEALPDDILSEEESRLLLKPLPPSIDLREAVPRIHTDLRQLAGELKG